MTPRTSLLRQYIERAMTPQKAPWLILLGICSSQPITPIFAAEAQLEWSCNAMGGQWVCQERASTSPAYKRPPHAQKVRPNQPQKRDNRRAAEVDWIDEKRLTDEQRAAMAPGCCGIYQAPARGDSESSQKPGEAPIRASSAQTEWLQNSTTILTGDVEVTNGYRKLRADKASIDEANNFATLEGNIQLREPGLLLTGHRAEIDQKSGRVSIEGASYLLHDTNIRGDAGSITRGTDESLTLKQGSLTRCEPDDNTWILRGSEIVVDPETNQGKARHVRMDVKGVPIFYFPYLQFSTSSERQSGFLFPSIGTSDNGGLDLAIPYYFNLAPNYDLTLSPRYIGDRGEMLESEMRHLSQQFSTEISMAYLADDQGGDDKDLQKLVNQGVITTEEAYPNEGQSRWLLNIQQRGGLEARWYSNIDYTAVSDDDYFRDLDTASLEVNSTTHLKRSGTLGYRADNWNYQIKAEEFRAITAQARTPYKQLPRINIDGDYTVAEDFSLQLNHEYASFDHKDKAQDSLLTGDRVRLDYGVTWNKQWLWGFLRPSVKVKSLHYQFNDDYLKSGANDSPAFTVPQASIDTGLIFEREGSLFSNSYLQTFEPRLFYFYSDYENQDELIRITTNNRSVDFDSSQLTYSYNQLFRDTRFAGGDRIDDDNRLSVGLTSRFINPATGSEYLSASLGQIYYFDDRAIELNRTAADALADSANQRDNSEYAAQLTANFGSNWRWSADIMWDSDNSDRVTRGSSSLRYRSDNFSLFNLSYRYLRKDPTVDINDSDHDGLTNDLIERTIDQMDLSFSLPIMGNWSAIGRFNQDLTHQRELETLIGIEYNSCCYRTRIVARRWLDNDLIDVIDTLDLEEDQGIFIEFQFKSLGSIGTKVQGILYDSIYGYEDRDKNLK